MKAAIQSRLLITTTLVLGTFLSLTGWVLDRSFRASQLASAEEQLKLVVYSLMGAAEEDGGAVRFGAALPEPRLNQPESGLYAEVRTQDDVWRSPSAQTTDVDFPRADLNPAPGEWRFEEFNAGSVTRFFLSYAVVWVGDRETELVFTVATDTDVFRSAVAQFRRNLSVGLGAATLFFIGAQFAALRWGLRPLRQMAEEVRELEAGGRQKLSEVHPRELRGLAKNLDRFIEHEQRNRKRYRTALEDLAHSLKTPLAVIRNALAEYRGTDQQLLGEQLDRMENTVAHQLSRASVSGPTIVGNVVDVGQLVARLVRALEKAYVDRNVDVSLDVVGNVRALGDERDFMEVLGNVLENAFKYTRHCVAITVTAADGALVSVEDDGPGIEPELRESVLNRGTRADQLQKGQGIGLAVVSELVGLYKGSLTIDASQLGGAKIQVRLPG